MPRPRTLLHLPEPDYTRPLLDLTPGQKRRLEDLLAFLYGPRRARTAMPEVTRILRVYFAHRTPEAQEAVHGFRPETRFDQRDVILITYGDLLINRKLRPLEALRQFLTEHLRGLVNTVHILPFFPYSSDRGFSILDYDQVDPRLGTWEDVEALAGDFRLMFDGVFNHVSAKSRWFQRFLNGRPGYDAMFIAFSRPDAIPPAELRKVLRPRPTPLLSAFPTIHGTRWVWTTFSRDQVDLNFRNELVLFRVLEILLNYLVHGAELVRLDAVTYVWKAIGTSCANLPQTHALVKFLRAALDVVAPEVALITETNVPHAENVRYFGDGTDQAQLVYNFALPPLVLHAFLRGTSRHLTRWAAGLEYPSDTANYLNFLSSHDGIGLLGARGILPDEEIGFLVERCREHGGLVSQRQAEDGALSPYELNITWWSALNRDRGGESRDLQVARYLASRSVALALRGVPGIYLPSLFGAKNDSKAIARGAEPRAINRKEIYHGVLERWFRDPTTRQHQVLAGFRRLLEARTSAPEFHPNASQEVLDLGEEVFAVLRRAPTSGRRLLAVTSVVARPLALEVPAEKLGEPPTCWTDLLSGTRAEVRDGTLRLELPPYGIAWLRAEGE
ncbi:MULTISPECIES: alpha-amylase family glycosyl hydrolase [Deferrisoma]